MKTQLGEQTSYRYCGRIFTSKEINWIRELITSEDNHNRFQLSKIVCEKIEWLRPDGRLKDMSCRVAMLRMHRDGIILLPEPLKKNGNSNNRPKLTSVSDPGEPITAPVRDLSKIHLLPVSAKKDSLLYNQLIERYHYLKYNPLPGAQLRYLVFSSSGILLAALGFGAAAWKVAPRDQFIGWSHEKRAKNLHLIVNNARFLILPWINSSNLASHILSVAAKQLPVDWENRYNYKPVLLETFVQINKFKGTCYKAANWTLLGKTQGRGKLDQFNKKSLPVKNIFVYPLDKKFKHTLATS